MVYRIEHNMVRYKKQMSELALSNRRLVEETTAGYQNIKDAKEKLVGENLKKKEQTVEETRALLTIAEQAAAEERARRDEIIMQIRALESMPANRTKVGVRCLHMGISHARSLWT